MESVEAVEKILNYSFTNKNLLKEAISNGSIESTPKFQRLEFLGDSVLEVAITNHIHLTAPNIRTKELRKLRHANVRNEKFARAAVRNNLYQYMIRDTHDLQQTKQVKVFSEAVREENGPVLDHGLVKAPKVLADLVESIAGAVYIDVNFDLQRFWEIFRGLLEPIYTMDDLLAANKALRQLSESMHIETIVDEDNLDVETEDKKEISSTESFQLQTGSSSLPTASEMAQEEEMVIDEDSPHVESEDAKGKSCEIFSTRKLQIETGSSSLSPNALTYEMTTKQMVVDEDSLEAGPEAKTKLFIICNKNKWPNPIFSVEEEKGPEKKQKYVCSVKIEIPSVQGTFHMKGDVKLRKKDAEYSAAYHMIRALNSSLMSLVISNLKMQKSLDEEKRKQNSLDEKKNLHSKKRKRKSLVENMNLQMLDKLEEKKNLQMQEILDEKKNLQTQEISDEKKNMQTQESLEKKKNLQTQESSEENKNLEMQEGLDKKKNLQMQESSDEKILNSVEAETDSVEAVEKILNYSFTNKTLLKDAITQHSSSYDRIKFVGEAALPHAITNHIYLANPTLQPTELTLLRAAIRTTQKYAFVAAKLGLHQFFIRNVKDQEKIKWFTELVSKEDNPDPHGVFVKAPHVLRVLLEILAGAVYIDVSYDIKRLWEIFKPLFEPICTLDDLRRQPQPVVTLFRWADKYDKRIEIRYSECSDGKRTVAQVFLDDELLACGEPRESWDSTKLTAVKKAIPKLLAKGFTVEMVMDEDSRHVEIEDAKEKLIEICNKRKLPNPIYSVEEKGEGVGYVCSATIETPTEEGTLCILGDRKSRRKIAENSSATHMIRALTFSLKDDM